MVMLGCKGSIGSMVVIKNSISIKWVRRLWSVVWSLRVVPVRVPEGLKSSPSRVTQRVCTSLWNANDLAVAASCATHKHHRQPPVPCRRIRSEHPHCRISEVETMQRAEEMAGPCTRRHCRRRSSWRRPAQRQSRPARAPEWPCLGPPWQPPPSRLEPPHARSPETKRPTEASAGVYHGLPRKEGYLNGHTLNQRTVTYLSAQRWCAIGSESSF